jgi:hypothetical protein
MSDREQAIADFKATMELEETLKGLVERLAKLGPDTVMIAWELNGEVDLITVPHSRLLAKSYADALYDVMWKREENDTDDTTDDLE